MMEQRLVSVVGIFSYDGAEVSYIYDGISLLR